MFVKAPEKLPEFYQEIIEDELNVKSVEFTDDVRSFTSYTFKPQLKTAGPKYGKLLNRIRSTLTDIDGSAAMDTLNEKGQLICPVWLSGNPTGLPAEPAAYRRTSCRTR